VTTRGSRCSVGTGWRAAADTGAPPPPWPPATSPTPLLISTSLRDTPTALTRDRACNCTHCTSIPLLHHTPLQPPLILHPFGDGVSWMPIGDHWCPLPPLPPPQWWLSLWWLSTELGLFFWKDSLGRPMDSLGLKDWNCSFILFFFFFFSYSFLLEIQFKERTGEKDKKMEDGGWRMEQGWRMKDGSVFKCIAQRRDGDDGCWLQKSSLNSLH